MRTSPFVALALASTLTGAPAQDPESPDLLSDHLTERLTAIAKGHAEGRDANGLAAVVDVGGQTIFAGGWGRIQTHDSVPLDPTTPVPAACLMDLFTVIAGLQLIDDGRINEDLPLSTYVEGYAWKDEVVTLHHLLTHTSGIAPYPKTPDTLAGAEVWLGAEETWKELVALPLESAPGSCQTFNGVNTYLAARLYEQVTGRAFQELLDERVIGALGLAGTRFVPVEDALLKAPETTVASAGRWVSDPLGAAAFGACSLVTTTQDLTRLVRALMGDKVISRRGWAHMSGTHWLTNGESLSYAHGLSSTRLGNFDGLSFGGANAQTRIHVTYYPGLDLTIALTGDCNEHGLPKIAERMVREVFDLPTPETADRTMPEGLADRVAGTYQIGCNRLVIRHLESGRLLLEGAEMPDYHLMYQGDGRFVAEEDHAVRLGFQVAGAHARSFALSIHGVDMVAVRVEY